MGKYDGNKYNEPEWYPENPHRLRRFQAFAQGLDGFGYHFAENETLWDEGAKVMLGKIVGIMAKMNPDLPCEFAAFTGDEALARVLEAG